MTNQTTARYRLKVNIPLLPYQPYEVLLKRLFFSQINHLFTLIFFIHLFIYWGGGQNNG